MLLVAMPGAPSCFLLLVAMPVVTRSFCERANKKEETASPVQRARIYLFFAQRLLNTLPKQKAKGCTNGPQARLPLAMHENAAMEGFQDILLRV